MLGPATALPDLALDSFLLRVLGGPTLSETRGFFLAFFTGDALGAFSEGLKRERTLGLSYLYYNKIKLTLPFVFWGRLLLLFSSLSLFPESYYSIVKYCKIDLYSLSVIHLLVLCLGCNSFLGSSCLHSINKFFCNRFG